MYGADNFAISVGGKIVAEERGGYYLIGLSVYIKTKKELEEEIRKIYPEELNRYRGEETKRFVSYTSLADYSQKAKGDVLFYSTPNNLFSIEKGGGKVDLKRKLIKKMEKKL